MLPNVNTHNRHEARSGFEGVLVGAGGDLEEAGRLVVPEPAPSGSLYSDSLGGHIGLHGVEGAEGGIDGSS